MLHNLFMGITLGLILFTIYVAIYVDGIIFRPNEEGELAFTPYNLFNLIMYPVHSVDFWRPKMWTLNSFFYVFMSTIIVYLTKMQITSQL